MIFDLAGMIAADIADKSQCVQVNATEKQTSSAFYGNGAIDDGIADISSYLTLESDLIYDEVTRCTKPPRS